MSFKTMLLMFSFLPFLSCKSNEHKADNMPASQIIFGNGGGFAGVVNSYYLLENGQIFFQKGVSHELTAQKNVKKKVAQTAFTACDALHLDTIKLNEPGNTYSFIERKTADGKSYRITWANDQKVSTEIRDMYTMLTNMVK